MSGGPAVEAGVPWLYNDVAQKAYTKGFTIFGGTF
jgi:hypothetical protein